MNRKKILVTRRLIPSALEALGREEWSVTVENGLDRAALLSAIREYDAIVAMLSDRFDAEVFQAAKGGPLKIVANYAVGYDNIDVAAASRAEIHATNTPDVLTDATAEMAWALVFAAARRIGEGERLVRAGKWTGWDPAQLVGSAISGKTVGILGAGRIGQAFGRMGLGFGVTLLYFARNRKLEFERDTKATRCDLDALLSRSDILSIHLPKNPGTSGILSAEKIRLMKSSAILVNTGRGAVIDESALAEALREKRIAAAGLDVYEKEPVIHPALFDLENVVLAPHLGSATTESRTAMAGRCALNIEAAFRGKTPPDALKNA
mgnify:CR=1 FL=1